MFMVRVLMLFVALVSLVFVSYSIAKSKKPIQRVLISIGGGIIALAAVNLLAGYTGFGIALNFCTSFITVVLGAPGVILLLVLRLVLIL